MSTATGIRTPVSAVRGRRPSPLDDGGSAPDSSGGVAAETVRGRAKLLWMRDLFSFPNPVNDKAARVVAAGVLTMCALTLATGWRWLLVLIATGFVLRVLAGPRLSPLGLLATRVVAPRLGEPRYVAGPPKRFAQAMGAAMTGAAAILALALDVPAGADALLAVTIAAASLEAGLGLCVGCRVFAALMRLGVIPERVCAECADIGSRTGAVRAGSTSG